MTKIQIIIKPNSKTDSIEKIGDELVVRVRAPAAEGKANARAIELIAEHFGIAKTKVKLVRGATSRHKVFEVLD